MTAFEPPEKWDGEWGSYIQDRPVKEIPINVKRNMDALMRAIRLGKVKPRLSVETPPEEVAP